MQLYVADYLGDTRHLTTEQHGAYLLLLMTMWRADGRLPHDDKKLARITGCTASRWARIKGDVLDFFDVDGADLTHGRLMLELKKASEKSIQRAEAGKRGGEAKARKTNGTPVANASDLLCHSSDIRSQNKKEEPTVPCSRADDFERFWAAYPRKVAKDAARRAFPKAVSRISSAEPMAVILAGIERALPGWGDPQFIPHPASWLNAGRWDDEAPTTPQSHANDRPDHHKRPSPRDDRLERMLAGAQRAVGP